MQVQVLAVHTAACRQWLASTPALSLHRVLLEPPLFSHPAAGTSYLMC